MRVFKTRFFSRWMRKTELIDSALCDAVAEMAQGLIDADLGGGVVKKRIGLAGCGNRSGARTLGATNRGNSCWPEQAGSSTKQYRMVRYRRFSISSVRLNGY